MTPEELIELGIKTFLDSIANTDSSDRIKAFTQDELFDSKDNFSTTAGILVALSQKRALNEKDNSHNDLEDRIHSSLVTSLANIKTFEEKNKELFMDESLSQVVAEMLHVSLVYGSIVGTRSGIASYEIKNIRKRMEGLNQHNKNKSNIQSKAKALAQNIWLNDNEKAIRIGDVACQIYDKLRLEGNQSILPENIDTIKQWIKPIAPDYAQKAGRPKKNQKNK